MYRRNLPHWHPDGAPIFVTWRLFGTLPPGARYGADGRGFLNLDRRLDKAAEGEKWLSEVAVAQVVAAVICAAGGEKRLCELHAFVVMPNHVHVLLTPQVELRRVTHWIKGVSAREGNRILGRTGRPFWQDESFDHWVRDHWEFAKVRRYIEMNPVRAGLVMAPEEWAWSSGSSQAKVTG